MTHLVLFIVLLQVCIPVSTAVKLQKRIIGGQQCERPYHVKLRGVTADGSFNLCGGSLISSQWILTAAHCMKPGRTIYADLGEHPAQEVQIKAEPVIYADKDNKNIKRSHDIMLLQLPMPTDIQPIALPDCGNHPKMVHIAGHAATTGGSNNERRPGISSTLHCAEIEIADCENLKNDLKKNFQKFYEVTLYQHWFCGQSPGKDICYGDSGGGAVLNDKIYGVISFLGDPDYICREAVAFMDLCNPEYAAWIKKIITN